MLVAFDMFGTLADTAGVTTELAAACGGRFAAVARAWRARQLEYMFRVTAMGQFPPFADLTRWSLVAALTESGYSLPERRLDQLAGAYRRLRPYPEVRGALAAVRERGHTLVAFSVGHKSWLEELSASYSDLLTEMVSAEEAGVYKPHPGIYRHLLTRMNGEPETTVLVSSNPFDIIGAGALGLRTAWCRRQPSAHFDPWGSPPDYTITSLTGLADALPG